MHVAITDTNLLATILEDDELVIEEVIDLGFVLPAWLVQLGQACQFLR